MISLSTVFGIVFGCLVISWGILSATTNWKLFLDLPSAAIVMGGTITSAFIGYRWRYIWLAFVSIYKVFIRQKITPQTLVKDVEMIANWARRIQKEGQPGFEKIAQEKLEPYCGYLLSLVNTGYTKEQIREFSETAIEEHYFRHLNECGILTSMAASAPAFGMVGTLIGLIVMLTKMEDPSQMGPGLSIALITTLYGVLFARFVFLPAGTKMKQILGIQRFREYLILEGVCLILEKRSTFYIQDKLNSYLDRNHRYNPAPAEKK